ncbi:MAG: pitrilysin family protein, partial [Pseudomonadota bacterium]
MRLIPLVVTILSLFAPLVAASEKAVSTYTLDNGLEIVVIEDHRAPVVTHMLWYRVGSVDEVQGTSGIAHFLEHLMFKGTDELGPGEFSRIVEANGGSDNAFTSFDYTGYFQRVASDRLGLMMKMEADRMRDLVLNEADVLTERQVVIEERTGRVDNDPASLFREQRRAALFLNHPYGRPIIGWRHEMVDLSLEDALEFYQTYYAPNNAILIVAGDVDPDEVLSLAQTHYGPLEPSKNLPERLHPQEPPHLSERRMIFRDARVRQPVMIRDYLAPSRQSGAQEEAASLSLLADLLGGDVTSHIVQKLKFEEQIALDAGAFYTATGIGPQVFGIFAIPAPGVTLEEVEARLDAAVASFVPDAEALARAQTRIRASQVYALDRQSSRAQRYGVA